MIKARVKNIKSEEIKMPITIMKIIKSVQVKAIPVYLKG